jgi:hypothetical protein
MRWTPDRPTVAPDERGVATLTIHVDVRQLKREIAKAAVAAYRADLSIRRLVAVMNAAEVAEHRRVHVDYRRRQLARRKRRRG